MDFNETWYEHHVSRGHCIAVPFNLGYIVITKMATVYLCIRSDSSTIECSVTKCYVATDL